ncbi:hypothetical protein H6G33_07975 [Calothrix sp. FACHB-1219]|uniref:hypothetical protein n=1 Tax=unclassified Calothrix TaxID=2619626 RepID=UPI00168204BB|nr:MULTISPECIES: hypothetical protein [unclassified Calothrix]MBD2201930.1 hypothetical protein [Calothrix sp. FACHB-168]MBD2216966.1 hypothetical protein [Calothrix sp. FACHB-1219]
MNSAAGEQGAGSKGEKENIFGVYWIIDFLEVPNGEKISQTFDMRSAIKYSSNNIYFVKHDIS